MNKTKKTAMQLMILAATIFMAGQAAAATEIYLKLDGVPGESVAANHVGEIQLSSYSQSVSRSGALSTSGAAAGKAVCGQIILTKPLDKSSPLLIRDVFTGRIILNGVVSFVESGSGSRAGLENYSVTLEDILVTSVQQSDSSGPNALVETVILSAAKFKITYRPTSRTGQLGAPEIIQIDCSATSVL